MKTIAIIGGGFSGTMTAVNLSRLSDQPLRVVIVNFRRPLGRGTAYGTNRGEHLLNVAARNMSALPDFPSHFFDWLRSRSEYDDVPDQELRQLFAPRRIYGDYLRGLLATCLNPIDARCEVKINTVHDEAVGVAAGDRDQASVLLAGGDSIDADRVVLATGNQPPRSFSSGSSLAHDDRYCADPWDDWSKRIPAGAQRIIMLGSGLTMVDAVLTLSKVGWQGEVVAISRNGMLPNSHFRGIAYEDYLPDDAESLALPELVKLVERHCDRLRNMSQNTAIAIDKLRPHTQRLWRSLSTVDKEEFLGRYAARWNVTRHRIAASIHETITDALDCGRLKVNTGAIRRIVPTDRSIDVEACDADGHEFKLAGDFVVNCTGPEPRFSRAGAPLFDNLLEGGLVRCDQLDMGIEVDEDFAVIDRSGAPSRWLYAIGPLLRGSLWETTAVPELRGQAMRIAETLLQREPALLEEEDVIEYYI